MEIPIYHDGSSSSTATYTWCLPACHLANTYTLRARLCGFSEKGEDILFPPVSSIAITGTTIWILSRSFRWLGNSRDFLEMGDKISICSLHRYHGITRIERGILSAWFSRFLQNHLALTAVYIIVRHVWNNTHQIYNPLRWDPQQITKQAYCE